MIKFSKIIKDIGFSFSFKRLKKALLLITLFTLIGLSIYFLNKYEDSEIGLKKLYEKEISGKIDIEDNSIIRIYKKDINEDNNLDFVFIMGKEKRSGTDTLNSTLEMYNEVTFVVIDGKTNDIIKYDTKTSFEPDVTLKIIEDENDRYFLISDYSGNIDLIKIKDNKVIDIIGNTTSKEFLGYTIDTIRDEGNPNILTVKLDNYGKDYLKEYKDVKSLDFTNSKLDLKKYRETYLRDKFSKFEFKDINNDGILELVTTQYILYSLDDSITTNKTIGKVEVYFNIKEDKLVYNKIEINI